jgi:GNAT superfamily N-acetyltransferase
MSETYVVVSEESPTTEDIDVVRRGLGRFNQDTGRLANYRELTLFVRDGTGRIVGGLLGYTIGTWFRVEILWLDARIRGKGYGTCLLQRAEEEALARGCIVVDLTTFDFQAPQFYEKRGYVAFGELREVGAEHTLYFFRKYLVKRCDEAQRNAKVRPSFTRVIR